MLFLYYFNNVTNTKNMNRKNILILSLFLLIFSVFSIKQTNNFEIYNNDKGLDNLTLINNEQIINDYTLGEYTESIFKVYDTNNNLIFERNNVVIDDIIIDKNFNMFQIYEIDAINKTAKAKFIKKIETPTIVEKEFSNINNTTISKNIGLYNTHNDESYEIGDGYSSIYGAGGIHDITKKLSGELEKLGINTYYDETLHIPHDYNAYSRSKNTVNKLLTNNLNALFDIHRDGASRSTYVKKVDNNDKCMVRIVVGQANPNKDANLKFALYLMSVAKQMCPWLFLDIYYAHGEYNQSLNSKNLLFEMGSHLVEKELVLQTVPYLAKVINATLFQTTIDSDKDEIVISNNNQTSNNTVDKVLDSYNQKNNNSSLTTIAIIILVVTFISLIVIVIYKKTAKIIQKRQK